jgi:hypothetical protein
VSTLLLLLKVAPVLLEIVKMIQQYRLTSKATDEMLADLQQTADYLVTRSDLARAEVKDSPDAIASDSFNRD